MALIQVIPSNSHFLKKETEIDVLIFILINKKIKAPQTLYFLPKDIRKDAKKSQEYFNKCLPRTYNMADSSSQTQELTSLPLYKSASSIPFRKLIVTRIISGVKR